MAMMYDRHLSLVTRNGHIPLVQTLEEHGNAGKVKENMDGTGVQCLTPVQGVVPAQGSVHCLTLVLHWPRALDYFIWRLLLPPIQKIKALQRANYFAGAPSIPLSQKGP